MATVARAVNTSPYYSKQLRRFTISGLVTLFGFLLVFVYLLPLGNMFTTALRSADQLSQTQDTPIIPMSPKTFNYQGQDYPIMQVPTDSGVKEWAIVQKRSGTSQFVDPANPGAGLIAWQGNFRTLQPVQGVDLHWENFTEAWNKSDFPLLFRNTFLIAAFGVIGTLLSCICVAYAFARFPIPGKNILFLVLIGTIILPSQVTLVPTFAFFAAIGWTGTWLPLIVPHFFANAYNVFLLRQYFLTLPRELDQAAQVDGASPLRILWSVIVPQAWPAIIAVALFHFFFPWNDFFAPLVS